MNKDDKFTDQFIVPMNAVHVNEFLGVKWTRWLEAGIFVLVTTLLISLIPFVLRVQIIVTVALDFALAALSIHGIHGRTVTSFLYLHFVNKFKRIEYHLGSIYDDRKAADAAKFAGKSGIERIVERIKQFDRALEERYMEGDDNNEQQTE